MNSLYHHNDYYSLTRGHAGGVTSPEADRLTANRLRSDGSRRCLSSVCNIYLALTLTHFELTII